MNPSAPSLTEPIRFSKDFVEYARQFLVRKPVMHGDSIIIPIPGTGITFNVVETAPGAYTYVTTKSIEVVIREEPLRGFPPLLHYNQAF